MNIVLNNNIKPHWGTVGHCPTVPQTICPNVPQGTILGYNNHILNINCNYYLFIISISRTIVVVYNTYVTDSEEINLNYLKIIILANL